MSFTARARIRLLAAIAAGAAGCHETKSSSVELPPQPQPSTTDTAVTTAQPPPSPTSRGKCQDDAKVERLCVAPHTPPSNGAMMPAPPAPFAAWDKNGCYQGQEIVGACSGIRSAAGPFFVNGQCCFDVCQGTPAPCGRPLLVAGQPRLAPVVPHAGWERFSMLKHPEPAETSLRSAVRERAARAWQKDAALEHASVAAFARLSLELLALGAPSDLVAAAHGAALDEVEHARVCFGIATSLLGVTTPLGPARLDLEGLVVRTDLAAVAREAASESCVGETVAALALARAAEQCGPGSLRERLCAMADQELSHAAFGWQLVAWACREGGPAVREAVLAALAVRDYDAPTIIDADEAGEWRALGRLTRADMREVVREARALVDQSRVALAASSARERMPSLRNTLCS